MLDFIFVLTIYTLFVLDLSSLNEFLFTEHFTFVYRNNYRD